MKRNAHILLLILLIMITFSVAQLMPIEVSATSSGNYPSSSIGNWIIDRTTIIKDEIIIMNGNITVVSGGVLILKNTTVIFNCSYNGQYHLETRSGGNLTIIDSKITALNPAFHYYIQVFSGSKFYVNNSEICYAGYNWGYSYELTGIWINTENVIIENSYIHHNFLGIELYEAKSITLYNVTVSNNDKHGINMGYSDNITLLKCVVYNNSADGIDICYTSNVEISECNIGYNNYYGLFIWDSDNVTIRKTLIHNNYYDGVEISNSGFSYSGYSNIALIDCFISDNNRAVYVHRSRNVEITSCIIFHNFVGVRVDYKSYRVVISECNIIDNHYGVDMDSSSTNILVYLNNFVNNFAYDDGARNWDNGTYGNFWSDYAGIDEDENGIGDSPHYLDNDSADRFPLMKPYDRSTKGPNITDISQTPNMPTSIDEVTITANVTDPSGVLCAMLGYYNGTAWNYVTMTYNASTKLYEAILSALPPETTIYYRIYACNIAGNWSESFTYNYTVRRPPDFQGPNIINVAHNPPEPTNEDEVIITANVTDPSGVAEVYLSYYNGITWNNLTMTYNVATGCYEGKIPPLPVGTVVQYRIYALDRAENWATSDIYNYTVMPADTQGPYIAEISHSPSVPTYEDYVLVVANVTDPSGVIKVILELIITFKALCVLDTAASSRNRSTI